MRNVLEGSKIARGRKNLRNIKKQVVRNPATLAQTIRRLILLTVGGALSTTAPDFVAGRAAAAGTAVFGGAGTVAGGVPDGVSTTELPCSWLIELSTNANLRQSGSATSLAGESAS